MIISNRLMQLALVGLVATEFMTESTFRSVLRYSMMTVPPIALLVRIVPGFYRRWPYWTASSWSSFFLVASLPVTALLLALGMAYAIDQELPIAGASQSPTRGFWILGALTLALTGLFGVAWSLSKLTSGEPSDQFRRPRWLGGRDA